MPDELLIKKVRVRVAFAIGWAFGGAYLFFNQSTEGSWFLQNGWWLCFMIGFINLVEVFFITKRIKSEAGNNSE